MPDEAPLIGSFEADMSEANLNATSSSTPMRSITVRGLRKILSRYDQDSIVLFFGREGPLPFGGLMRMGVNARHANEDYAVMLISIADLPGVALATSLAEAMGRMGAAELTEGDDA